MFGRFFDAFADNVKGCLKNICMIVVYIVEYLLDSCMYDKLYPMQQVAYLF